MRSSGSDNATGQTRAQLLLVSSYYFYNSTELDPHPHSSLPPALFTFLLPSLSLTPLFTHPLTTFFFFFNQIQTLAITEGWRQRSSPPLSLVGNLREWIERCKGEGQCWFCSIELLHFRHIYGHGPFLLFSALRSIFHLALLIFLTHSLILTHSPVGGEKTKITIERKARLRIKGDVPIDPACSAQLNSMVSNRSGAVPLCVLFGHDRDP